jgi:hypothetical protein
MCPRVHEPILVAIMLMSIPRRTHPMLLQMRERAMLEPQPGVTTQRYLMTIPAPEQIRIRRIQAASQVRGKASTMVLERGRVLGGVGVGLVEGGECGGLEIAERTGERELGWRREMVLQRDVGCVHGWRARRVEVVVAALRWSVMGARLPRKRWDEDVGLDGEGFLYQGTVLSRGFLGREFGVVELTETFAECALFRYRETVLKFSRLKRVLSRKTGFRPKAHFLISALNNRHSVLRCPITPCPCQTKGSATRQTEENPGYPASMPTLLGADYP